MNKELLRRSAALSLTFVLVLISIFSYILLNSGYAWFAKNSYSQANGMNVSVKSSAISSVGLTVHPVTKIDGASYTFTDEVADTMPMYDNDPAGINFSQYDNALVFEFTLEMTAPDSVTVEWVTNQSEINLTENNFLSNAITVCRANAEGNVAVASEPQAFVTASGGDLSKVTALQPVTFNGLAQGENKIYFVAYYNTDFLNYVAELRKTNLDIPNQMYYHNNNDISFIFSPGGT